MEEFPVSAFGVHETGRILPPPRLVRDNDGDDFTGSSLERQYKLQKMKTYDTIHRHKINSDKGRESLQKLDDLRDEAWKTFLSGPDETNPLFTDFIHEMEMKETLATHKIMKYKNGAEVQGTKDQIVYLVLGSGPSQVGEDLVNFYNLNYERQPDHGINSMIDKLSTFWKDMGEFLVNKGTRAKLRNEDIDLFNSEIVRLNHVLETRQFIALHSSLGAAIKIDRDAPNKARFQSQDPSVTGIEITFNSGQPTLTELRPPLYDQGDAGVVNFGLQCLNNSVETVFISIAIILSDGTKVVHLVTLSEYMRHSIPFVAQSGGKAKLAAHQKVPFIKHMTQNPGRALSEYEMLKLAVEYDKDLFFSSTHRTFIDTLEKPLGKVRFFSMNLVAFIVLEYDCENSDVGEFLGGLVPPGETVYQTFIVMKYPSVKIHIKRIMDEALWRKYQSLGYPPRGSDYEYWKMTGTDPRLRERRRDPQFAPRGDNEERDPQFAPRGGNEEYKRNFPALPQRRPKPTDEEVKRMKEAQRKRELFDPSRYQTGGQSKSIKDSHDRITNPLANIETDEVPYEATYEGFIERKARRLMQSDPSWTYTEALHQAEGNPRRDIWFYLNDVGTKSDDPHVIAFRNNAAGKERWNRHSLFRIRAEVYVSQKMNAMGMLTFYEYRKNYEGTGHPFRSYLRTHSRAKQFWIECWEMFLGKEFYNKKEWKTEDTRTVERKEKQKGVVPKNQKAKEGGSKRRGQNRKERQPRERQPHERRKEERQPVIIPDSYMYVNTHFPVQPGSGAPHQWPYIPPTDTDYWENKLEDVNSVSLTQRERELLDLSGLIRIDEQAVTMASKVADNAKEWIAVNLGFGPAIRVLQLLASIQVIEGEVTIKAWDRIEKFLNDITKLGGMEKWNLDWHEYLKALERFYKKRTEENESTDQARANPVPREQFMPKPGVGNAGEFPYLPSKTQWGDLWEDQEFDKVELTEYDEEALDLSGFVPRTKGRHSDQYKFAREARKWLVEYTKDGSSAVALIKFIIGLYKAFPHVSSNTLIELTDKYRNYFGDTWSLRDVVLPDLEILWRSNPTPAKTGASLTPAKPVTKDLKAPPPGARVKNEYFLLHRREAMRRGLVACC